MEYNNFASTHIEINILLLVITLAAKRRRKGMVIILCVCVCVSVCSQKIGKTTNIDGSNELLADFKLYKDQK